MTPARNIVELRKQLAEINKKHAADTEAAHAEFDTALLAFIDDPEVSRLYQAMDRHCT